MEQVTGVRERPKTQEFLLKNLRKSYQLSGVDYLPTSDKTMQIFFKTQASSLPSSVQMMREQKPAVRALSRIKDYYQIGNNVKNSSLTSIRLYPKGA